MSQKTKLVIFQILPTVLISTLLVGMVIYAWKEPSVAPPNNNAYAPINVSSDPQAKAGNLSIGTTTVSATTSLYVNGSTILNGGLATLLDTWLALGNPIRKVGIGTMYPDCKLDVRGDVCWTGTLQGGSIPWVRLTSYPSACPAGQFVTRIDDTLTCASPSGGGGGGVTSITAGTGLSGGTITTSGTISLSTTSIANCTNATNNKIIWDSTNNRLTCATDQTGGGVTKDGSPIVGSVAFWTGTNSISGESGGIVIPADNLFWSASNNRLGIRTSNPSQALDVRGRINVSEGLDATQVCIRGDCRTSWPGSYYFNCNDPGGSGCSTTNIPSNGLWFVSVSGTLKGNLDRGDSYNLGVKIGDEVVRMFISNYPDGAAPFTVTRIVAVQGSQLTVKCDTETSRNACNQIQAVTALKLGDF